MKPIWYIYVYLNKSASKNLGKSYHKVENVYVRRKSLDGFVKLNTLAKLVMDFIFKPLENLFF
jgi:hypothetical protein